MRMCARACVCVCVQCVGVRVGLKYSQYVTFKYTFFE